MSEIHNFIFSYVENVRQEAQTEARVSGKSTSWLMAFAKLMGEVANNVADQMMAKAREIDKAAKDEKPSNELTAELTALSQLFKMVTEATSNVIKSVGEGNTSMARKQ